MNEWQGVDWMLAIEQVFGDDEEQAGLLAGPEHHTVRLGLPLADDCWFSS